MRFYWCVFVSSRLDVHTNARQEAGVCVCAPLRLLAQLLLLYHPRANFCSPRFMCFLEIPSDRNQLLSWLTRKQLHQTLHYSPLAPTSPLLFPLLIFSLARSLAHTHTHTHFRILPWSPGCWQAILSEPKFKTQLCLGMPTWIAEVLRKGFGASADVGPGKMC